MPVKVPFHVAPLLVWMVSQHWICVVELAPTPKVRGVLLDIYMICVIPVAGIGVTL
jgi:hypothetical protein